jgi:hypothetical protein
MPQNRAHCHLQAPISPAPVSLGAKQPNRATNDLNAKFKKITMAQYFKKMDKIISKHGSLFDAFEEMIKFAGTVKIIDDG